MGNAFLKLIFILILALPSVNSADEILPTYFQYDLNEIKDLSQLTSNKKISNEEIIKWDEITKTLSLKYPISSEHVRMCAYLYTAQRDAAFLSYNLHGEFIGSIGSISSEVLNLFFPSAPQADSDAYSKKLAQIVLAKIKQRLDEENAQMKNFPIAENDPRLKILPQPYYGLKIATTKPWLLKDPTQFMASTPPPQEDLFWEVQSEVVKEISEKVTDKQKEATKFWAGASGPQSGDSYAIMNNYLFTHDIPLAKIFCVRSIVTEAGIDVDIAIFFSKYTFVIKRPKTLNPSVFQHIPFPKHPTYPSGHSTWFPAWATILTHYFPDEKNHWFQLAEEAGKSRIWGGIHFPIDHREGWILGIKLGNQILESPKVCF